MAATQVTPTPDAQPLDLRSKASAFIQLTKPGIIRLLVLTTVCTMIVANRGVPELGLLLATLIGTAMVCGSANALNMVWDQDIDQIMNRTAHRPLVTGELNQTEALAFAGIIGLGGVVILTYLANPMAALMGIAGHVFYVVIYTMILKRRTPQNIVIGGAAGAFPPLIGWAAVTGDLSLTAWLIFTIIFLWTPPHFWALALYKDVEYEKANIPMMPVVRGHRDTKFQMLIYTLLLVGCTTFIAVVGLMGIIYLISSVILGAGFAYFTIKCAFADAEHTEYWAKRLFAYSILYVALLFGAMSLDGAYQWHFTERNHLMSIEKEAELRRAQQSKEDLIRLHNGEVSSLTTRPR